MWIDVSRLLESLLHVPELKQAVPIAVCAHFRMNEAFVFQRVFRGHHGRQRFVIDFHEFCRVLGNHSRFSYNCDDRLPLVHDLVDGHRIVRDFLSDVGANFNEGIHHALHFRSCQRADDSRQRGRL